MYVFEKDLFDFFKCFIAFAEEKGDETSLKAEVNLENAKEVLQKEDSESFFVKYEWHINVFFRILIVAGSLYVWSRLGYAAFKGDSDDSDTFKGGIDLLSSLLEDEVCSVESQSTTEQTSVESENLTEQTSESEIQSSDSSTKQ